MASRMIGVEFGSNTLKLAVCVGGVVKQMAVSRMPEDMMREGRMTSAAAMTAFLKDMMRENGIRGGNCAMVLPPQVVLSHHVTVPVMSEKELQLNLPFEFRDFTGKDGAHYDYDYVVHSITDQTMELYAAAVHKDVVEEYYAMFKKAGLTLKLAIPAEMAWCNLIAQAEELPEKLCIVDIGHSATRVNIFDGGRFVMGKDIDIAGALIDATISENQQIDPYVAHLRKESDMNGVLSDPAVQDAYHALAIEVMKIINFYSYTSGDGVPLEHLYYCGGSAVIEPLRTALLKNTGLTLHHVFRLVNMDDLVTDQALYCALAAGAAIQK